MTIEQSFIAMLSVACGALGWFAREIYTSIKGIQIELSALQVQIARDYVRYDRLQQALEPIKEALDEIKAELKSKVSKP